MYLINFLRKNLFSFFFFLISLKLTKIKLTSSALSFSLSLFARFSIPERKHERRQLVKFFPLLFWPNWMRNSPVTQSDRPPPPPPPSCCPYHEYAHFFHERMFRHATAHPLHTVIFRLRIQNRGNSKGTTRKQPRSESCTDLTGTFVIKECRYPYRCIFRQRYVAFSSPVTRSRDTCIFLFPLFQNFCFWTEE